MEKLYDLLHARTSAPLEKKNRGLSPAALRGDDQILGEKLRVPRDTAAAEVDRLGARPHPCAQRR